MGSHESPVFASSDTLYQDGATYTIERLDVSTITAVSRDRPASFALHQNTPNPANPTTTIRFTLRKQSPVTLTICNAAGQTVDTIVDRIMSTGQHAAVWSGAGRSSGIYFYRLHAGGETATRKMMLLQ
jgi:hypothetical protein